MKLKEIKTTDIYTVINRYGNVDIEDVMSSKRVSIEKAIRTLQDVDELPSEEVNGFIVEVGLGGSSVSESIRFLTGKTSVPRFNDIDVYIYIRHSDEDAPAVTTDTKVSILERAAVDTSSQFTQGGYKIDNKALLAVENDDYDDIVQYIHTDLPIESQIQQYDIDIVCAWTKGDTVGYLRCFEEALECNKLGLNPSRLIYMNQVEAFDTILRLLKKERELGIFLPRQVLSTVYGIMTEYTDNTKNAKPYTFVIPEKTFVAKREKIEMLGLNWEPIHPIDGEGDTVAEYKISVYSLSIWGSTDTYDYLKCKYPEISYNREYLATQEWFLWNKYQLEISDFDRFRTEGYPVSGTMENYEKLVNTVPNIERYLRFMEDTDKGFTDNQMLLYVRLLSHGQCSPNYINYYIVRGEDSYRLLKAIFNQLRCAVLYGTSNTFDETEILDKFNFTIPNMLNHRGLAVADMGVYGYVLSDCFGNNMTVHTRNNLHIRTAYKGIGNDYIDLVYSLDVKYPDVPSYMSEDDMPHNAAHNELHHIVYATTGHTLLQEGEICLKGSILFDRLLRMFTNKGFRYGDDIGKDIRHIIVNKLGLDWTENYNSIYLMRERIDLYYQVKADVPIYMYDTICESSALRDHIEEIKLLCYLGIDLKDKRPSDMWSAQSIRTSALTQNDECEFTHLDMLKRSIDTDRKPWFYKLERGELPESARAVYEEYEDRKDFDTWVDILSERSICAFIYERCREMENEMLNMNRKEKRRFKDDMRNKLYELIVEKHIELNGEDPLDNITYTSDTEKYFSKRTECELPRVEIEDNNTTMRSLNHEDRIALHIGDLTDCCQALEDVGHSCAVATVIESKADCWIWEKAVYITKKGKYLPRPFATSFVWEGTVDGDTALIFDNIELERKYNTDKKTHTQILTMLKNYSIATDTPIYIGTGYCEWAVRHALTSTKTYHPIGGLPKSVKYTDARSVVKVLTD